MEGHGKVCIIGQLEAEVDAVAQRCAIYGKALRVIRDAHPMNSRDWMIAIATNALNGEDTGP